MDFPLAFDRIFALRQDWLEYPTRVAELAGICTTQMSRWRRRERTPTTHSIQRMCEVMECTPKEHAELLVASGHRALTDQRLLDLEVWLASVGEARRERVLSQLAQEVRSHPV